MAVSGQRASPDPCGMSPRFRSLQEDLWLRVLQFSSTSVTLWPVHVSLLDTFRSGALSVRPGNPRPAANGRGQESLIALGLISNTGNEIAATLDRVLVESGLSNLVDADLCLFSSIEGLDKSDPAFFRLARDRAALPAGHCMFVGRMRPSELWPNPSAFACRRIHFRLCTSSRPSFSAPPD